MLCLSCVNDKFLHENSENWTNNVRYLRNDARYEESYYYSLIGSRIWAFDWYHNYQPRRSISGCGAKGRETRSTDY